jgi:hypothetical protein
VSAEARYRFLLLAYPRGYRAVRGDEMLDVLLSAEERRGRWSVLPEAATLVVHGLAARVRQSTGLRVPASAGVAGVALALLLAVLGTAQLSQMGLRGLGLDGYPRAWMVWRVWIDPRWPIALAWIATAGALLLRRYRLAVLLAWTAVLLHGWLMLAGFATGWSMWWIGELGPAWFVPANATQASWFVLTVCTALLLGGPTRARRGVEALPVARWSRVLVAGLVGCVLAGVAAPLVLRLAGPADVRLTEQVRGPVVPVLLATLAVVALLRRSPYWRGAVALLALAGLVPVLARWSDPAVVVLAGGTLFLVGYVAGAHRRPRPLG